MRIKAVWVYFAPLNLNTSSSTMSHLRDFGENNENLYIVCFHGFKNPLEAATMSFGLLQTPAMLKKNESNFSEIGKKVEKLKTCKYQCKKDGCYYLFLKCCLKNHESHLALVNESFDGKVSKTSILK